MGSRDGSGGICLKGSIIGQRYHLLVFFRRRITDGLNFMYNSWFKEEVHVCCKYLGELCNQLYKFERDLSKPMCIEFVE